MTKSIIMEAPKTAQHSFMTTTINTHLPQRDTLEEIIINLSTILGANRIYKQENARGNYFYKIEGITDYQSASNSILDLSRALARKFL